MKRYHVNTNGEDTLTMDSRYEVGIRDLSKDDVILQSYGRIFAHYLNLQQNRMYTTRDNTPERLSYIYKVYLRNIADATGTPKSELDAQIETYLR